MGSESLIGPLPDSWRVTTLGDACRSGGGGIQTGPFGSQLHAADYVADGIPSVMPQNIGENRVVEPGIARISRRDADRLSRYRVRQGDIVYSRRGDVEKRALVREHEDGWLCGTGCLRIRFGEADVDPVYASYYLGHPQVRAWITQHAHGATMPNLNTEILSETPFVVPPLEEQRRIGGILGALDDKIELNRRMSQTLESMARALFKSWFIDFDPVRAKAEGDDSGLASQVGALFPSSFEDSELGDIPKGWRVGTISSIADVVDCSHAKKPDRGASGRPLLQLDNIRQDGVLDMSDPYLIGDSDYQAWTARIEASPGDCVITNVGRVGAVAQVPSDVRAALGRNMTAVRCRMGKPWPTYLVEALRSDSMRDEIVRKTDAGTILDALNVRSIPRLRFVEPSAPVLSRFETVARQLRAKMESIERESRGLQGLRDAMLPSLLAGNLPARSTDRVIGAMA